MKTIITIPDFTREAHLKKILPNIIKKLSLPHKDIEIIIGTGLHRSPTKKEIRDNLGSIVNKIKISVHNHGKNYVSYFGKTKNNIPIYLNKKIKKASSIITVGVVEPHLRVDLARSTRIRLDEVGACLFDRERIIVFIGRGRLGAAFGRHLDDVGRSHIVVGLVLGGFGSGVRGRIDAGIVRGIT